jgi:Flp pilus assembly protein protease CpaA
MLLYAVLAGGLLALAYAARRRRLGAVARNLTRLGAATQERGLHRMPYALAIALGCAWAIASRYLPALGLL